MPNALIRESILQSPSFWRCSQGARELFILMRLLCDHTGRMEMSARYLHRTIYMGQDESVTVDMVESWLLEHERESHIRRWMHKEHTYGQFVNFAINNPGIRAKSASKIPGPDGSVEKPRRPRIVEDKPASDEPEPAPPQPMPTPREERVLPREVVQLAEELVGGVLSTGDVQAIKRWLWAEKHPVEWVLSALGRAIEQQPNGKPMAYVDAVIRGYANDGGPQAPQDRRERQARSKEDRERAQAEQRAEADKQKARAVVDRQAEREAWEAQITDAIADLDDETLRALQARAVETASSLFGKRMSIDSAPARSCLRSLVAEHIGMEPLEEQA